MDAKPHLTIQMVTWNSASDLHESLPVLAGFPHDAVTIRVIDNGSTDESVALVKQLVPQAEVIELSDNYGFATAHNIGFAQSETELVMVYNPDLKGSWEGIKQVLAVFDDATVGSAQGLLLRDERTIDSAGIVMTKALNGKEQGAGEPNEGQYRKQDDVAACTGAAAIYRSRALYDVMHGDSQQPKHVESWLSQEFYDDDFFAYKEDVDLGWRLRRAGWKNIFVPVVQGTHVRSVSDETPVWKRMNDPRTRYSFRNWIWMIYKNASLKELLLHEIFIDARLLAWAGLTVLHPKFLAVWLETLKGLPKMITKRGG